MLRDPELLEFLEGIDARPWSGFAYRVVWQESNPALGSSGKRGRWSSPRGEFEILYTSLEKSGAEAEFEAFWTLFEQRPDRTALTHCLRISLNKVIHLDIETLDSLGVPKAGYEGRHYSRTQEIADAVNFLGCDALISPSARYPCDNVTIFFQNLSHDFELESVKSSKFIWSE